MTDNHDETDVQDKELGGENTVVMASISFAMDRSLD